MKVAPNRWVSLTYAMLAVFPIGLLLILVQDYSFGGPWANRGVGINPAALIAIGLGALVLSVICFSDRVRSRRFRLCLLLFSLLLTASWVFVTGEVLLLPTLIYGLASWGLWRANRLRAND